MRRSARTGGITMLGAALLALLLPATAVATPPDDSGVVERTTTDEHWLWAGDGVFVLEGPPIEEGCFGEGFDELGRDVALVVEHFGALGETANIQDVAITGDGVPFPGEGFPVDPVIEQQHRMQVDMPPLALVGHLDAVDATHGLF